MATNLSNYFEFENHRVDYLLTDGTWWISLEPICTILGLDWATELATIREHDILGPALVFKLTQSGKAQFKRMAYLSRFHFIGWLFSLQIEDLDQKALMWKCYIEISKNLFHHQSQN